MNHFNHFSLSRYRYVYYLDISLCDFG